MICLDFPTPLFGSNKENDSDKSRGIKDRKLFLPKRDVVRVNDKKNRLFEDQGKMKIVLTCTTLIINVNLFEHLRR